MDTAVRKILIVENYPDSLEMLELLFKTQRHIVYGAPDGNMAADLAELFCPM